MTYRVIYKKDLLKKLKMISALRLDDLYSILVTDSFDQLLTKWSIWFHSYYSESCNKGDGLHTPRLHFSFILYQMTDISDIQPSSVCHQDTDEVWRAKMSVIRYKT